MRNLKKILALVLALVMSLSLMATASAAESTSAAADPYATAEKVLTGLAVYKGDYGTQDYRWNDSITRAEVAALVYRIATSDVDDAQTAMYTNHDFTDVKGTNSEWANGYIAYGYNAEILKGNGDKTFSPAANVTGYQVLAMILRTMGYGKNGEFEGANWEIQTAATAKQEGLLKGITAADEARLGEPAPRRLVAQILFNALLQPTVKFNVITPNNYQKDDQTLGYQKFGMEEIVGVVMANQWADLENDKVLADGKTRVNANAKDYRLDYATERDDIGESRLIYVQNGTKVLHMEDSQLNNIKWNEGKKDTVANLRGELDVADAEHFVNFADVEANSSEWLIRYSVTIDTLDENGNVVRAPWYANNGKLTVYGQYLSKEFTGDYALFDNDVSTNSRRATVRGSSVKDDAGRTYDVLTVTLQPGTVINNYDRNLMQKIFYTADRFATNPTITTPTGTSIIGVDYYVDGEVYAGTTSLTDKSDVMSWNQFVAEYLTTDEVKVTAVENGNELKIIDNNNDGKAEYVLKTVYTLDKIVRSAEKDGETIYYYQGLNIDDDQPVYLDGYTPALEDVVLYALIDGTAQMQKAASDTATFKAVSYKDETATDENGKVWNQSGIDNATTMYDILPNVNEYTSYTLYLDKYENVRAYTTKTNYALVTEIYPTNTQNQAWVTSKDLTAEVVLGDAAPAEYNLANAWYSNHFNPFYTANAWTYEGINDGWWWSTVVNNIYGGRPNYLNRAQNGLGTGYASSLFDYRATGAEEGEYTWTNVAKYSLDGNNITLSTAANYTADGNRANRTYWTEDYIQLAVTDVSNKNPLYKTNDRSWNDESDEYVRAVDDTEFFVVARADREIKHYVGYSNVPSLTIKDNGIRAMYAVAETTNADIASEAYWVGNVIVIEIETFGKKVESVSLIYSNDYKVVGDIKYLQAIDNEKGPIGIIPTNWDWQNWQGQFNGRGFYTLSKISAVEGATDIYYAELTKISDSIGITPKTTAADGYNANGIYYGVVRSLNGELSRSNYITVDKLDLDKNDEITWTTTFVKPTGGAYGIDGTVANANTYVDLINDAHANKQVQVGDEIVWVEGGKTFLVDLTDTDPAPFGGETERDWYPTPSWLYVDSWLNNQTEMNAYNRGEVGNVILDQITAQMDTTKVASFYGKEFTVSEAYNLITVDYATAMKYWQNTSKAAIVELNGWKVTSCTVAGTKAPQVWPYAPTIAESRYDITVEKDGKSYTFTLVQEAAKGNGLKVDNNYILSIDSNNKVETGLFVSDIHISDFIAGVEKLVEWNGSLEEGRWEFIHNNGYVIDPSFYSSTEMNKVDRWRLVLVSEDGTPAIYWGGTTAPTDIIVIVKTDDGVEKAYEPVDMGTHWELEFEVEKGVEPIVQINGVAYRAKAGSNIIQAKAAGTETYTVIIDKALMGNDTVIVVILRAYVTGEPTETPAETTTPSTTLTVKDGNTDVTISGLKITVDLTKVTTVAALKAALNIPEGAALVVKNADGETLADTDALAGGETITVTNGDAEPKTYNVANKATEPDTYTVTVDSAITNGTVVANPATEVEAGETVTLTVTPSTEGKGYKLGTLTVKTSENTEVETTEGTDGKYTFMMPADDVNVTATFVEKTTPDANEQIKAKVTFDTDGSLKAEIYTYKPMGQALNAEEIAGALSQENYPGTTTKLTVSADDVDLTAKTAKDSTSGETIKLVNVQAVPTYELVKVTYPVADGTKDVYVIKTTEPTLTGVKSGVKNLMVKSTTTPFTSTVYAVNSKSECTVAAAGADTEYVVALELNITTAGTSSNYSGGTATVATGKEILVGYLSGTTVTSISSNTHIQAGAEMAFGQVNSKVPAFGNQVAVTVGKSTLSLPVEKDAEGNDTIATKTIQITEDMVNTTSDKVDVKIELKAADIPVYYNGELLGNKIDTGNGQYIFSVPAGITKLVYVAANGETLTDSSATISNGVATYNVDATHAVDGASIKLLPAYEVTGNEDAGDYDLYTGLNTAGTDVEGRIDNNKAFVLANEGKVYLKAASAHVILGITSTGSKSTISSTIAAPSLALTGDGTDAEGIWEITLGGDLNVSEIGVIASTADTAKANLKGDFAVETDKEVDLTDIVISKDCTVSVQLVNPASVTGADKLTVKKVDTTTDATKITVTVSNPAAADGGTAITAPASTNEKNVASFRVQLTVGGETWTVMVPFNLVK